MQLGKNYHWNLLGVFAGAIAFFLLGFLLNFWPQTPWITSAVLTGLVLLICVLPAIPTTLAYLCPWTNSALHIPLHIRSALNALNEGVLLLDRKGRVTFVNEAFVRASRQSPVEFLRKPVTTIPWGSPDSSSSDGSKPWLPRLCDGTLRQPELLTIDRDQRQAFHVTSSPLIDGGGHWRGVIISLQDVSKLQQKKAELATMLDTLRQSANQIRQQNMELDRLSTRDSLTGCYNRRSFFEFLDKYWLEATRHRDPLACLILDVDDFKTINEVHGTDAGDKVLRNVGDCLLQTAREHDVVCRYAAEEFMLLMPRTSLEDAVQIADQLRLTVQRLQMDCGRVTVSLGVSALSESPANPQELLDQTDRALIYAKSLGRNKLGRYDETSREFGGPKSTAAETRPTEPATVIPYPAVSALISALAYRDITTASHSRRVADLCVAVGQRVMSLSSCYILEIAALLHDIGKIGVPDAILLKPAPLTDEEWQVMHCHDRIGAQIIRSSFGASELSAIVENYTTNYQKAHRAGFSLPLGARILAVADAYDSMVTDQVYRPGMSQVDAEAELRSCAGTQFDPEIVAQFLEVLRSRSRESVVRLEVARETALALGMELERLAEAVDRQELSSLRALAGRLSVTAAKTGATEIAAKAIELENATAIGTDLLGILRSANELLSYCRATQLIHVNPAQAAWSGSRQPPSITRAADCDVELSQF
ncbi:diguanylate cyclase [Planctomicrobium sp. SH664]|uniref:bifunctional diguanylate cyclase/phosphohydrolase n=1 Tax=Planctomicrobium sp. SH664 TaxID=3448125 RepID=UPI003F5BBED8